MYQYNQNRPNKPIRTFSFKRINKKFLFIFLVIVVIGLAGIIFLAKNAEAPSDSNNNSSESPENRNRSSSGASGQIQDNFDKNAYSLSDPSSPWVIVNKKRPLPSTYAPSDLTTVGSTQISNRAARPLTDLIASAKNSGISLYTVSGYRSYSNQASTYNGWVSRDGRAKADTYSARPGYSEHQTGLAVDVGGGSCDLQICFGSTQAGKWLAANAHRFGFIIRYPEGKQSITGYQYEPWHIRFVGTELANQVRASGLTLEQFFGLPAAPNY
jgi:D-alanyl-D-alanine carboxypeptidase